MIESISSTDIRSVPDLFMSCSSVSLSSANTSVPSESNGRVDGEISHDVAFDRCRSSPDVNQFTLPVTTSHETTTCDEAENPDQSRHKRSAVRRRKSVLA